MQIETKYSIGQSVWGVRCFWCKESVECEACHGEGGAMIPGTRVRATCQECSGEGSSEKEVHEYYPHRGVISSISIRVDRYRQSPEVTYYFSQHIGEERFHAVCDTTDEAVQATARLADADDCGIVSTRWLVQKVSQ